MVHPGSFTVESGSRSGMRTFQYWEGCGEISRRQCGRRVVARTVQRTEVGQKRQSRIIITGHI